MSYDRKKRRKMKKFEINEISAVDRPAQSSALAVIMKRDNGEVEKAGDLVDALTSTNEDHQHGISVEESDGDLWIMVHYATGDSDGMGGHDHKVVVNASGEMVVSENMGHSHELDMDMLRNLLFSRLANKREGEMQLPDINNILDMTKALGLAQENGENKELATHIVKRAEALGMMDLVGDEITSILKDAADNGGGQDTGDDNMSKTDNAANDTAVVELQKKLNVALAIAALNDIQKAHYETLDETAQEAFLAKSSDERDADITLSKSADAVVYKSLDGEEFRKSDDPRLVAMVKRADAQSKALEKAAEREAENDLRKRAEDELSSLPGDTDTHVALLKAVDGIADEAVRKSAMEVLKSKNQAASAAFTTVGTTEVSKAAAGEAHDELDRMAKAHQAKEGVDFYTAYDAVTKAHPDLYAKAING